MLTFMCTLHQRQAEHKETEKVFCNVLDLCRFGQYRNRVCQRVQYFTSLFIHSFIILYIHTFLLYTQDFFEKKKDYFYSARMHEFDQK